MHNGFVNVDNEKMAKSLGNFFRIRDVLDSGHVRDPEVLRFFLASSQYRGPINYSLVQIEQADAGLSRLYTALRDVEPAAHYEPTDATRRFEAAMDDDFNTPEAVAVLQSLATEINRAKANADNGRAAALAAELLRLGGVLGVLGVADFLTKGRTIARAVTDAVSVSDSAEAVKVGLLTDEQINELRDQRTTARKTKNFRESDRIRDELARAGVILEDKPDGTTTWRRA